MLPKKVYSLFISRTLRDYWGREICWHPSLLLPCVHTNWKRHFLVERDHKSIRFLFWNPNWSDYYKCASSWLIKKKNLCVGIFKNHYIQVLEKKLQKLQKYLFLSWHNTLFYAIKMPLGTHVLGTFLEAQGFFLRNFF